MKNERYSHTAIYRPIKIRNEPDRTLAAITIFCFLVAMLPVLIGCDESERVFDPFTGEEVVMSLDVGNSWTYRRRINDPGASPDVNPIIRTITMHHKIEYEGEEFDVAVEVPAHKNIAKANWPSGWGRLLRNEPDGLYCYGNLSEEGQISLDRYLVAPIGCQSGDQIPVGNGNYYVCVATDSLVVCEFGAVVADLYNFVTSNGTLWVPDIAVVPGVGLITYYTEEATIWMIDYSYR